ncbi:hypothetical protein FHT76_005749 [Rhizobium sp. BK176]|nr:hypothetical protein [Rhizobium sp. BK176]
MRVAEIADGEPRPDLAIGVFGQANGSGGSDTLQTRGNVDAVAHQVTIAFLHYISQMDANPELDAPILLNAGIALDHAVLHLDGAAHGIDNAAEFNQRSVSGALDDTAVVHGDGWIDEVAAQCPQPCKGAIFVLAGEPAVSDYVRGQNCGELAVLTHEPSLISTIAGRQS